MSTQIKTDEYQSLYTEIISIYTQATTELQIQEKKILNRAYWNIGRRIVNEEQRNKDRAGYGDKLIERLSQDLTAKFGKGFSTTNIRYMRQYYTAFPIRQTSGELSWSQYQVLSTVKDKDKREDLHDKALKNNWSVRDIKSNLTKDNIDTYTIDEPYGPKFGPGEQDSLGDTEMGGTLRERRGMLNTYRIKYCPIDESKEKIPLLDCGFTVMRELPNNTLESIADEMMVESIAGLINATAVNSDELYTYKAQLERVVDGDTIIAVIDCGFGTWVRQRLRLRGIDAPELTTTKGQLAAQHVERELKHCPFIIVKTYKTDKYDRYLTDIFYDKHHSDAVKVAAEGKYLNQELLDQMLAVKVK